MIPAAMLLSKGFVLTKDCFGVACEEFRADDGFPKVADVDWGESSWCGWWWWRCKAAADAAADGAAGPGAAAAALAEEPLSSSTDNGVCSDDALAELAAAAFGSICNRPVCVILLYTSSTCCVV